MSVAKYTEEFFEFCKPPTSCFQCPYADCIRADKATQEEVQAILDKCGEIWGNYLRRKAEEAAAGDTASEN